MITCPPTSEVREAGKGDKMAASSKKVLEVFVSKIPWTVASKDNRERRRKMLKRDDVTFGKQNSEEMKEYFGQFGPVKRCLLPFDKETGFHRGFCWVGFFTEEGLNNALQKDPHILEGAKLQVQRNRRPFAGQKSNQDGYLG